MKKIITILIISTFIFTPFVSFAQTNNTPAYTTQSSWATGGYPTAAELGPYNGSVGNTGFGTNGSWQTQGQWDPTTNAGVIVSGASGVQTTGASAADQAAYESQLGQMYTGYPQGGPGAQSPASAAASGCIGSFVGSWVGGMVSKGLSTILPTNIKAVFSVSTTDAQQEGANFREETLDGIAFCIGNALIDAMSASIVQWINNGFKNPDGTSGPGFLTNPGEFFKQMADREVGGFFQELGIIGNILCRPFDLQIRLGLLEQYNSYGDMNANQCTLDSIKQNLENFGSDDYLSDWFQLTQESNNNAIGAHFLAREKLSRTIIYNKQLNSLEVNLGSGFLSLKKCVVYSKTKKDPNSGKPECEEWETIDPGKNVQATLDRAIGSKTGRLEIATNFNQIIAALVNQIIIQAIGGLSGGNDYSSGGGGNSGYGRYTDQRNIDSLINDTFNQSNGKISTSTNSVGTSTATTTVYYTLSVYSATSSEYGIGLSQSIRGLNNPYRNYTTAIIRAPLTLGMELRGWSGCTSVINDACYVFMDSNKSVFVDMKRSN